MPSELLFSDQIPCGLEPRLSDVLNDPLIHAVMARDGVTDAELRSVICRAQRSLKIQAQR